MKNKRKSFWIIAASLLALCIAVPLIFNNANADVKKGFLGIYIKDLNEDLRGTLEYQGEGAFVEDVVEDSPAEEAGIEPGDIVIVFDGKKVKDEAELRKLIKEIEPGQEVKITVFRDKKEKNLSVKIGDAEDYQTFSFDYDINIPPYLPDKLHELFIFSDEMCEQDKGGFLGVVPQDMSEQLAEYFGVKGGALIGEVIAESPAEKAGVKTGDAIIEFDGRRVDDESDIRHFIGKTEPGDKIQMKLVRKGKEMTVTVEIGEKPEKLMKNLSPQIIISPKCKSLKIKLENLDENLEELEQKLKEIKRKTMKSAGAKA